MKKIKKEKNKEPIYLKYFTYNFLQSLLDSEIEKEYKIYTDAMERIGDIEIKEDKFGHPLTRNYNPSIKDKRATEQLLNSYRARTQVINDMKKQLTFAYSKSAHPNLIANKDFFPKYE
jgi:hypothetical protein